MFQNRNTFLFTFLLLLLVVSLLLNISFGQVAIPLKEVFKSLLGSNASKETWEYIIINFRLPKAITAILVGIGLSISGLLMQTLFRNPLAGPYVLGLSSGSSLGVAFVILGAGVLPNFLSEMLLSSFGIIIASCLGSLFVLLLVLLVSNKLRDTMSVLIVGLMFSSFAGAIVSVLTYFSTAEQLQKFTFWSLGSIGNLSWNNIIFLSNAVLIVLILSLFSIKSLDALLLGENYARSLGLNIKKSRLIIIFATSILAGSITAFAGPIAFVGLAVPHLAKLLFQTSNHKILFFGTILIGAIIMLFCDMVSQMPGMDFTLPINAITSIVGAPVVIWLLLSKKRMI
ncbi:iron ABC transporter permease [Flavobacterium aquatile]|uniref:Iron ABC transporter n=1 Tax=Flavobacterium aquatile LMG 4008 = ATCC 11947 TaxID=1453498 RepID=A0A095SYR4_9FLAO|nr:iron ABC transporter permease [Flavobacterium aquatile]KGD69682.1 iron ABC transporter [Flavobacterium aquatile LMG 4008 = ATCC 11947]OXA67180.1 iron ABC transporter [Flavobacterium aquatile] [Flavobacterium aquatile LMG 4008 = ATCC 11947]